MIKQRLIAILIDYVIVVVLYLVAECISMVFSSEYIYVAFHSLPFVYLLCRDSFTGKSIGRYVAKISVVDKTSRETISPMKAFIRNLFLLVWPIELIVLLFKGERIGDLITNSTVVMENRTHKPSIASWLIFIILWLVMGGFVYYLMNNGLSSLLFK
jgi:uncharacterized RDD family membrane protein YckC